MGSTEKVLGTISAINTFIENFPMSILDVIRIKKYNSVFDFIIDVLNACGVNINDVIGYLLREIYDVEVNINGGIEAFYQSVADGTIDINVQSEFLGKLEMSIKGILMALLSSIFTCSAIPILPSALMDKPNANRFAGKNNTLIFNRLENGNFTPFNIPISAIDPMGLLQTCPTSDSGRLFYNVNGVDRYYKKTYVPVTKIKTETNIIPANTSKTITTYKNVDMYNTQIGVYMVKKENGGGWLKEDEYVFCLRSYTKAEEGGEWVYNDNITIDIPITVSVKYYPFGNNNSMIWEGTIPAYSSTTTKSLILSPIDIFDENKRTFIQSITLNHIGNEFETEDSVIGEKIWIFLDREGSDDVLNDWTRPGYDAYTINNISWGGLNNQVVQKEIKENITVTEDTEVTEEIKYIEFVNLYEPCDFSEIGDKFVERVNYVTTEELTEEDPEFVVCYEGLNPSTLYQAYDMNAFLWYVINKGITNTQIERNHMMWDSRISANKLGCTRKNAFEWNEWYASKSGATAEFEHSKNIITDTSLLFPIIQVEPQGTAKNLLRISLPSQRYYLPSVRNANVNGYNPPPLATNASIYKFNLDYLNNIQILQPKLLLVGLCESLLGFSLSTISSININLTKKIIERKLSTALKQIIEADDMEIEDCFMEFSNDEVNTLMEEMLLSRYNATVYGGESNIVREHDTQKYVDMLDKMNANATINGTTTELTRLITEVTVEPGLEGSINYGLQISADNNILKKLLWAIIMPILMSLFTPQVLLLLIINFEIMGLTKLDSSVGFDFGAILNLLFNKIFGLIKSIILFIKDKIIELLLLLFYDVILPLLIKYSIILLLERLNYWLEILKAALSYITIFKFKRRKIIGSIDEVDYADIINTQNTPETSSPC